MVAKTLYQSQSTKRSKWSTNEFKFYYLVFIVSIPLMIYLPLNLSNDNNPNFIRFKNRLSDGWLFNRKIVYYVSLLYYIHTMLIYYLGFNRLSI